MISKWSPFFIILAMPAAFFAATALIGIGVLRQGPPAWIAGFSVLLVVLPPMALIVSRYLKWVLYALGLLGWSMSILYVFPVLFPGERGMALHVGCSLLSVPDWAEVADDFFPKLPEGLSPATIALPAIEKIAPSASRIELDEDGVVLPVEAFGASIAAPLVVESHEIWLLFDTGASLTTMSQAALEKIGFTVPEDAPIVQLRTANGLRESQLVLISDVWFGGLYVGNVTIAVCEPCADDKTDGLLGLNISSRFLVTVDAKREELVLHPREDAPDLTNEIKPWVDIEATVRQWPDGRTELDVSATNISHLDIAMAELVVICGSMYTSYLGDIDAYDTVQTRIALPLEDAREEMRSCDAFQVGLKYANWRDP